MARSRYLADFKAQKIGQIVKMDDSVKKASERIGVSKTSSSQVASD